MKVFISWSGDVSHKVAILLRDWLPSVIQSITPYVSSEDIDKGARWSSDIAGELDESSFGVLCVTEDNLDAPWLNFEAGALGKSVGKSRVCPFLFRIKRSSVTGPILQYQSTIHDKEDVFKLLKAINEACGNNGIEESRLEKSFEIWWPKLDEELGTIESIEVKSDDGSEQVDEPNNYISSVLEEVLEISRTNQKLLRDPTTILPPDYLEHVIEHSGKESNSRREERLIEASIDPRAMDQVAFRYGELLKFLSKNRHRLADNPSVIGEFFHLLREMDMPLRHVCKHNHIGFRLPREVLEDEE